MSWKTVPVDERSPQKYLAKHEQNSWYNYRQKKNIQQKTFFSNPATAFSNGPSLKRSKRNDKLQMPRVARRKSLVSIE